MLAQLLALQRQVGEQQDAEELETMALAAVTLAQDLLALYEKRRQCAGTYWRTSRVVEPHIVSDPKLMGQCYMGPVRDTGEPIALCNACGSAHHRDRKRVKKEIE
jgi:hypothetical protein